MKEEQVLVIPRDVLSGKFDLANNFIHVDLGDSLAFFNSHCSFMPRPEAEYDFGSKQIIPYVVIRCDGEVYLLKRLGTQTEKRLHNLYSMGVGGHINPTEEGGNMLMAGLFRELLEEVKLGTLNYSMRFAGLINDDATEVGRVHLGFVVLMDLEDKAVEVFETDKMDGMWIPVADLDRYYEGMESWSQIVYNNLLK